MFHASRTLNIRTLFPPYDLRISSRASELMRKIPMSSHFDPLTAAHALIKLTDTGSPSAGKVPEKRKFRK